MRHSLLFALFALIPLVASRLAAIPRSVVCYFLHSWKWQETDWNWPNSSFTHRFHCPKCGTKWHKRGAPWT